LPVHTENPADGPHLPIRHTDHPKPHHSKGLSPIAGRSAFRDVAACSDPTGVEPQLFFQRVPEGKTSKNRVHLDVHVDEDGKTAEAERLIALGAQVVGENADRGPRTIVMQDPEGNEFCLH
jgi:Glyoxalase-like domain